MIFFIDLIYIDTFLKLIIYLVLFLLSCINNVIKFYFVIKLHQYETA